MKETSCHPADLEFDWKTWYCFIFLFLLDMTLRLNLNIYWHLLLGIWKSHFNSCLNSSWHIQLFQAHGWIMTWGLLGYPLLVCLFSVSRAFHFYASASISFPFPLFDGLSYGGHSSMSKSKGVGVLWGLCTIRIAFGFVRCKDFLFSFCVYWWGGSMFMVFWVGI